MTPAAADLRYDDIATCHPDLRAQRLRDTAAENLAPLPIVPSPPLPTRAELLAQQIESLRAGLTPDAVQRAREDRLKAEWNTEYWNKSRGQVLTTTPEQRADAWSAARVVLNRERLAVAESELLCADERRAAA